GRELVAGLDALAVRQLRHLYKGGICVRAALRLRGAGSEPGRAERESQDQPPHRRSAIFFVTAALRPSRVVAVTASVAVTLRRRASARRAFLSMRRISLLPPLPR